MTGITWNPVVVPDAVVTVHMGYSGANPAGFAIYTNEMTALNISSGDLQVGVMIRESPTWVSEGGNAIAGGGGGGGGNARVSFFDIFTELSTDGGVTWYPMAAGPASVILLPQVTIGIQHLNNTDVVLTWDNGRLQHSTNAPGIYMDLFDATSPFTITNAMFGPQQFFRVRVN